jgi:hypothetical protein
MYRLVKACMCVAAIACAALPTTALADASQDSLTGQTSKAPLSALSSQPAVPAINREYPCHTIPFEPCHIVYVWGPGTTVAQARFTDGGHPGYSAHCNPPLVSCITSLVAQPALNAAVIDWFVSAPNLRHVEVF